MYMKFHFRIFLIFQISFSGRSQVFVLIVTNIATLNNLTRTFNLSKSKVTIYDALRDLVWFVQFKKHKKHPWRSVTLTYYIEDCKFTKCDTLLQGVFSRFSNCADGTKLRKSSHMDLTIFQILKVLLVYMARCCCFELKRNNLARLNIVQSFVNMLCLDTSRNINKNHGTSKKTC